MPILVTTYKKGPREYLEVCPLDACEHEVGPKLHWVYEFPKAQSRDAFIAEALEAVAAKE